MGSKRVEEELDLESINTESSLVPQIPEDSNDEPKLPSKRSKKKDEEITEEEKDAVENSPTLKDLNKMLTESEIVALNLNILSDMTADDVEGSESESDSDTKDEDGEWDNFD